MQELMKCLFKIYLHGLILNAFLVTDHQFDNILLKAACQVHREQVSYNVHIKEFSSYNTHVWEFPSTVNRLPGMCHFCLIC